MNTEYSMKNKICFDFFTFISSGVVIEYSSANYWRVDYIKKVNVFFFVV